MVVRLTGQPTTPAAGTVKSSASLTPSSAEAARDGERAVASRSDETVRISGQATMLSRLFPTEAQRSSPNNAYSFLTSGDREVLAKAYEYAADEGESFQKVDALAFDLAVYRSSGGEKGRPDTTGKIFSLDGRPVINTFAPGEQEIASRILASDSLRTTDLDQGFIKTVLNPWRSPVHAVDLGFLEDVVAKFSAANVDTAEPRPPEMAGATLSNATSASVVAGGASRGALAVMSRLLGTTDTSNLLAAPNVRSPRFADHLTAGDKSLLSRIYESAKDDEDLRKVDALASSLGAYRLRHSTSKNVFRELGLAADSNDKSEGLDFEWIRKQIKDAPRR